MHPKSKQNLASVVSYFTKLFTDSGQNKNCFLARLLKKGRYLKKHLTFPKTIKEKHRNNESHATHTKNNPVFIQSPFNHL